MRVLNFKAHKFAIGKSVIIVNEYKCGAIYLAAGDTGKIVGAEVHNYPDLGLFNIRVIDLEFFSCDISMGEKVAEQYMKIL